MEITSLIRKYAMTPIPSVSIPPWIKRFFCWVFSPKGGLIILLSVLFTALVAVMLNNNVEGYIGQLLGLSGKDGLKNEILTFLGLSMGGVLLALQAVIANKRAKAMENAANAQAKANENTERGQRQERLKNAIEHLGHDSVSIRLGGAYELFHLAQDTKELRQTVLDILCSHIRMTTGESNYREDHKSKPSEEIQSLLTLLFVQEHEIFKGLQINLQGSWLNGADLNNAHLEMAVLNGAHLQETFLFSARLQRVNLGMAQLQLAHLIHAQLQGALLLYTELQGTNLSRAQLQGTNLFGAQLQGSNLHGAQLQGADLTSVQMQGVNLRGAQLQGVSSQSDHIFPFNEQIRDRINKESDLLGVTFVGGLTQIQLDSLAKKLSGYAAPELRTKLIPHVGKVASHELQDNSGAITGSYTKKEAEQWIAEYQKTLSEHPK